jgi:hypothetical protein
MLVSRHRMGAAVATRIVDVFLKDELVESYEVVLGFLDAPLFDHHFLDRAKEYMRTDHYTDAQIAEARFSIRE